MVKERVHHLLCSLLRARRRHARMLLAFSGEPAPTAENTAPAFVCSRSNKCAALYPYDEYKFFKKVGLLDEQNGCVWSTARLSER